MTGTARSMVLRPEYARVLATGRGQAEMKLVVVEMRLKEGVEGPLSCT